MACQRPAVEEPLGETIDEPVAVTAAAAPPAGTARLIVLLTIDQFGSAEFERLEPFFTAGLRELIDGSVVFPRAEHAHARSETAPGHATITTGRYPSHHGIVGNWWVVPGEPEMLWAADDDEHGKSPRNLKTSGLGGWLKDRYPESRVFAIGGKDRSAVMLGGREADAAFWYEEEEGHFETSSYYTEPEWFASFNQPRWLDRYYGELWEPLPLSPEAIEQLGIEALDLGPLRPRFPHVFGGLRPAPVESFYDGLWASPWLDAYVAELAAETVVEEELGSDAIPDLLAIGFSAPDYIGHRYGPHSREYVDALLRLDRTVGQLMALIDERVGLEHTVVAVTSDHGVVEEPELRHHREEPGARVDWEDVHCVQQVGRRLSESHEVDSWLIAGTVLAPDLSERTGLAREDLEAKTARELERCPSVAKVWTRSELLAAQKDVGVAERNGELWLFANNYHPERSPDFLIRHQEYLMRSRSSATTHGTSYLYDRRVPVLFRIPGVEPERIDQTVRTVDIAPTLASLVGAPYPADIDGEELTPVIRDRSPAR